MPVSSICESASRGVIAPANPAAAPTSAAPLKSRLLLLCLSSIRSSLSKYDIHCQAVSSIPAISVVDCTRASARSRC